MNGNIAIHTACRFNNPDIMRVLLLYKPEHKTKEQQLKAKTGYFENTPLHIAAYDSDDTTIPGLILEYGGPDMLKETNSNHDTPVHVAASRGHLK